METLDVTKKELTVFSGEYIEIKNVGKINSASIKINGLTVIAGVNDTGKSTAGKILFSIIKATSRYKQDLKEDKFGISLSKIEKLYNLLRRIESPSLEFETLRKEFYPRNFLNQVKNITNRTDLYNLGSVENVDFTDVEAFFDFKKKLLTDLFSENEIKKLIDLLDDIKRVLLSEENKQEQITRALGRALYSEFLSDITPKGAYKKSEIKYFAGSTNLLSVELKDNKIQKLNFTDDLSFKDVVFIETPLLIQMYDLIKNSNTIFDDDDSNNIGFRSRSKVSLHIKDLIDKIENAKYYSNLFSENDSESIQILENISNIINGEYVFDNENKELVFSSKKSKGKNHQVKAVNTASGIKSFGIIQLLIQASILNYRSLLIIDEPENHLHPEWQVKYAEMIIEMVKNDIPVIITSHSPYMIQALKFYSEKNNLNEKSNYYYAEIKENETQANLVDVTTNLNIIFAKLAEPLRDLVWK